MYVGADSAWTRMAIAMLVACCMSSCAPLPPSGPAPPDRILIPLSLKDSDYICAETPPKVIHNYCVTVREFRLWIQPSVRAEP